MMGGCEGPGVGGRSGPGSGGVGSGLGTGGRSTYAGLDGDRCSGPSECVAATLGGYWWSMAETPREIDWQGAEVKDGTVVLPLTGGSSRAWSKRFDGVLALLAQSNGRWGDVSLKKQALEVADVTPGAEDDLRHFLESIVVQVNAELAPEPDEQRGAPEDPQAARDEQMAEKLRSFSAAQE
jgi:hypothetical protein